MDRKIINIALVGILVAGCSAFPQAYDNNEHLMLSQIVTTGEQIEKYCDNGDVVADLVPTLKMQTRLLYNYEQYVPRNKQVFEIAAILDEDAQTLDDFYSNGVYSSFYCRAKMSTFNENVRLTIKTIVSKKRI